MLTKKRSLLYTIVALMVGLGLVVSFALAPGGDSSETSIGDSSSSTSNTANFLLDDYPIAEVPLFQQTAVSSNKFFVNTDPNNISAFSDKNFNYYNVVFYTDATQDEFIEYYTALFDEVIEEDYPNQSSVRGTIGQYRIKASHYGTNDTGYVQVFLPGSGASITNPYLDDYPELFDQSSPLLVEHESSYGLLNQNGGEIEYTKYFSVVDSGDQDNDGQDDIDEFAELEDQYRTMYQGKDSYSFDAENKLLRWQEDDYQVSVSLTEDHGRVYMTLRTAMQ